MTTSSVGVELTPGQRCLLDLLQRKLLSTIQAYANLGIQKQRLGSSDALEAELQRLKEKIRRISARQKRFTLEIVNGNSNNTIPKESFFAALGLVTKEALSKLNSKTNERRRRTTANPRFSHEAIQAKRALEPLQKRLEPSRQSMRDTKRSEATKRSQRHKPTSVQDQASEANNNNNNNAQVNSNQQANNANKYTANKYNPGTPTINNTRSPNNRTPSGIQNRFMTQQERRDLLVQYGNLQRQIVAKVGQINEKRDSNRKLERQNELIRKRGLDIISAMSQLDPNIGLTGSNNNNNTITRDQQATSTASTSPTTITSLQHPTRTSGDTEEAGSTDTNNGSAGRARPASGQSSEGRVYNVGEVDVWLDMKCEESIDGLE